MANTNQNGKLGFRPYFGTAVMGLTDGLVAALMTSFFMQYLTDYAGLGAFGAMVGSSVLLFSRIFDAVNDPLEGWLMNRAKTSRFGKYKPFIILSIFMTGLGAMALFFIPTGAHPVFTVVWVILFYLVYDMGCSFYAPNLIYRPITTDPNARGKLLIAPRLVSMLMGMTTAALIAIVTGVNAFFNNMHTAFGVTVCVMVFATMLISLLGIAMVKERYHESEEEEQAYKVRLRDFITLLKENKAIRVRLIDRAFGGFIWTFLFSCVLYYLKWGLCTDLTTGQVDNAAYATYSMISSMLMFLPLLLGTAVASPIMKAIGSPMKFNRILLMVQAVSCGALCVFHFAGVFKAAPILFLITVGVTATAVGCGYIPGTTLDIECMDYEVYKAGKDRSALCNAFYRFLDKAQSAIANSVVGFMLVAIGYVVDSTTGDFAGDVANMPSMLNWFIIMMGLIPCLCGLASYIATKFYPIDNKMRADMQEALRKN